MKSKLAYQRSTYLHVAMHTQNSEHKLCMLIHHVQMYIYTCIVTSNTAAQTPTTTLDDDGDGKRLCQTEVGMNMRVQCDKKCAVRHLKRL